MTTLKRAKRLSSLQSIKDKRPLAQEAPKSIITITEAPGGGFTIGLGLHGARMDELYPDQTHPVSIVDVIALAVANIVRTQPQDFQNAVKLVNDTLLSVNEQIEGGADADDALAQADEALGGAVASVEG